MSSLHLVKYHGLFCRNILLWVAVLYLAPPSTALDPAPTTLRFVFTFVRHGIRAPLYNDLLNENKEEYKEIAGQVRGSLTVPGKQLMYKVGQELRTRYKDFVGEYREDQVYFSSTTTSRTIMSALLAAAGMFPPSRSVFKGLAWQPIPVWQNIMDLDKSYMYSGTFPDDALKACPKYGKFLLEGYGVLKKPDLRPQYQRLYELLQEGTGNANIKTPLDLYHIFDNLYFMEANGLDLPPWAEVPQKELDNKPMYPDLLFPFLAEWFEDTEYYKKKDDMLSYYSGPFFNILNSKFVNKAGKKDLPDLLWYHSTHDTQIYVILRSLRIDVPLTAEPGCGVIFEMHEEHGTEQVKIFVFDSKTFTMKEVFSPLCPAPCTLTEFTSKFKGITPEEWQQKCKL